jgi:hypothetical protein
MVRKCVGREDECCHSRRDGEQRHEGVVGISSVESAVRVVRQAWPSRGRTRVTHSQNTWRWAN